MAIGSSLHSVKLLRKLLPRPFKNSWRPLGSRIPGTYPVIFVSLMRICWAGAVRSKQRRLCSLPSGSLFKIKCIYCGFPLHGSSHPPKLVPGPFYLIKEGCKGQGVIITISVIKCFLCIRYFNTLFQSQQLEVGIILIYRAGHETQRANGLKITQWTSVRGRVQTQILLPPKHMSFLFKEAAWQRCRWLLGDGGCEWKVSDSLFGRIWCEGTASAKEP